jgi:hypothetical protein
LKPLLSKLLKGPDGVNRAIAFLHGVGLDKGESIETLIAHGVSYEIAKTATHNNEVWKDLRERDEQLHRLISECLESKE